MMPSVRKARQVSAERLPRYPPRSGATAAKGTRTGGPPCIGGAIATHTAPGRVREGRDGGWRHGDDGGTDGRPERARSLRDRQRLTVKGFAERDRPGAGHRPDLPLRPRHDARDPRGLRLQPPGDDPGLPRHRQVHAYRAGGGAAELALRAGQPRQPHQPDRPDRQGRDQDPRRAAGDRVPGGDPALVPAEPGGDLLRRVRRRAAGRDVRDPAGAGGGRQADASGPEQGDPAASLLPAVLDGEHGRARRHDRALSRDAADQPGPDGPLVDRGHAQLSRARRRAGHRAGEIPGLRDARGAEDGRAGW